MQVSTVCPDSRGADRAPRGRIRPPLPGTLPAMTPPSAKRNGIQGSGRLVTGLLVSGACLFASLLVGLSGPVLGEGGKCVPTVEDAEGPFYKPGAPERLSTGSGLAVSGEVLSYVIAGCKLTQVSPVQI